MRIFKSLLGVILALVFYVVIFTLFFWALELMHSARVWAWVRGGDFCRFVITFIRGYPDPPLLMGFYSNLFASGIGAFLAIAGVNKILRDYNKMIVFYGFSAALMLFTIRALTVMIPAAEDLGFGWYEFSIQILTPIVAIGAAFFATCILQAGKPLFGDRR